MDELDLARRAVRRGTLSEEQLREAQSFASGGRSLLSVLLDLGYLRPQDIADLTRIPPPESRRRSWGAALVVIAGTVLATLALSKGGGSLRTGSVPDMDAVSPRAIEELRPAALAPLGPALLKKALETLSLAEASRKTGGGALDNVQEKRVRHAAELLEEAVDEGADTVTAWNALGRAHEILDHWEFAAEWYRKAVGQNEHDPAANLGLARVLLLLDRPHEALTHATAACQSPSPGEAYMVRARASMSLGNRSQARLDLSRALEADPSLRALVRALQQRLDE